MVRRRHAPRRAPLDRAPARARPALRREPSRAPLLAAGDEVGFWKVVQADRATHHLVLVAQVRSPGRVTLDLRVRPHHDGQPSSSWP